MGIKNPTEECETCENRKYQDGSDEHNVSFKAATHISPNAAASAVRAHEGQHVSNAYKKAAQEDGKVLRASVTIHTSICPECGRSYVAGGTTRTLIRYGDSDYDKNKNYRFMIPTSDADVLLLNMQGEVPSDWNFTSTADITTPLQCFNIKDILT